MSAKTKFSLGMQVLGARLLGRKVPLSVGWVLTEKCNAKCLYCAWNNPAHNTPHDEAISLCDQYIRAGVRIVTLTGGEPLIRDDIGELIRVLKSGGLYVILNSNGRLVPEKTEIVRLVDKLVVSIDGPEEIHDRFRGRGSFADAVNGLREAKRSGVSVGIAAVLHKSSVTEFADLLRFSRELDCSINFQPVETRPENREMENDFLPTAEAMHQAFLRLIDLKKGTDGHRIENSLPSLRHFLDWPSGAPIVCESRLVSCRVESDGHVHHCGRYKNDLPDTDYRVRGFLKAFLALPRVRCNGCWCANRFEINALASLNPKLMRDMIKRF